MDGQDTDLEVSDTGNILIAQEIGSGGGSDTPNINTVGELGGVNGAGDMATFTTPAPGSVTQTGFITPDDVPNATDTLIFETPLALLTYILVDTEAGSILTYTDSDGDTVSFDAIEYETGGLFAQPDADHPNPGIIGQVPCVIDDSEICIVAEPPTLTDLNSGNAGLTLTAGGNGVLDDIAEF